MNLMRHNTERIVAIISIIFIFCGRVWAQEDLVQYLMRIEGEEDTASSQITIYDKTILDTIDTGNKFIKILIFDDHTWDYLDLGKPDITDLIAEESWETGVIHSYNDVKLSDIPEEVTIVLIDSVSGYSAPYIAKVYSGFRVRNGREHKGVDLPLNIGDPVKSAFDGVVRVAKSSRYTGGYGNILVIRHTNGLETFYAHLSKILVKEGETVKAGETVALGGNSGRSTGPHLHFETRYLGKAFDPVRLFDFETGELRDSVFALKKHYLNIYSHYGQSEKQSIASSQKLVYTIKSGDTLSSIAAKYGTTVDKICKLNNMSKNSVLRVGTKITVR